MQQILDQIEIIYKRKYVINALLPKQQTQTKIIIMKLDGQHSDFFRAKTTNTTGKMAIVNAGFNANMPTIGGGGINGFFAGKITNLNQINNVISSKIKNSCISDCYICEWKDIALVKKIGDIMLYIRGPTSHDTPFEIHIENLCKNMASLIETYNKNKIGADKITVLRLSGIATGIALSGDPNEKFKIYMRHIMEYLLNIGLEFIELAGDKGKGWPLFDPMNDLVDYSEEVKNRQLELLEKGDIEIKEHNIKPKQYPDIEFIEYNINDKNIKTLIVMKKNATETTTNKIC